MPVSQASGKRGHSAQPPLHPTSAPEQLELRAPPVTQTRLLAPPLLGMCDVEAECPYLSSGAIRTHLPAEVDAGHLLCPTHIPWWLHPYLPTLQPHTLRLGPGGHRPSGLGPTHRPKSLLCPNSRHRSQGREQYASMISRETKAQEGPGAQD